jgi:hypothetical protein
MKLVRVSMSKIPLNKRKFCDRPKLFRHYLRPKSLLTVLLNYNLVIEWFIWNIPYEICEDSFGTQFEVSGKAVQFGEAVYSNSEAQDSSTAVHKDLQGGTGTEILLAGQNKC